MQDINTLHGKFFSETILTIYDAGYIIIVQLPRRVNHKRGDSVFRNLRAEMAREGLDGKIIANGIGVTEKTFSNKLSGKTEFTRSEMLNIRNKFFPGLKLEYLFELKEELREGESCQRDLA